jgi:hypothetical protein
MKNYNAFRERVRELVHDPAFSKPIADLTKDYSKQGTITLVTRIKPQPNYGIRIETRTMADQTR